MSYELDDKEYGEQHIKIMEGILSEITLWSRYHGNILDDSIYAMQIAIKMAKAALKEMEEKN